MSEAPEKRHRRPRMAGGAAAVGAYVPKVARAAFEAHGFPSAGVLADWPGIIGPEFAGITTPERLVWPRNTEQSGPGGTAPASRTRNRRTGATLVLRVEGPRALEVQHAAPQLLERINVYFGYRAVAELRIVQGPVRRETAPDTPPAPQAPEPYPADGTIGDEGLRAALARLGGTLKR